MGTPDSGIAYGAAMPDPTSRWIYIVTPMVGVPLRMISLAERAVSVLTHWVPDLGSKGKGRTVPHTTPDDTCPICVQTGQRPRWHAYLACWWDHSARYCMMDLTAHAVQSCRELDPSSGFDLRGYTVMLRRMGTSSKSPVKADVEGPRKDVAKLPAPFSVEKALERLWGVHTPPGWRTGRQADDVGRPE